MKITLRKANVVQAAINEAVKALDLNFTVTLNEFEPVDAQIQTVRTRFQANCDSRNRLVEALYAIRKSVSQANYSAGIDSMLADVARLEKQIGFYTNLAKSDVRLSSEVINGRLDNLRNTKEERRYLYGHGDVSTSVLGADEVEAFKKDVADLKRQKQKLQDALLELNVRTEIELDADTVSALEDANIL